MKLIEIYDSIIKENENPLFADLEAVLSSNSYKIDNTRSTMMRAKKNNSYIDSYIDIEYNELHPAGKYYVSAISKIIVKSTSLSNPKLNYQDTSARKVAFKKINDREYFNDLGLVKKYILKHISKIEKVLNKI